MTLSKMIVATAVGALTFSSTALAAGRSLSEKVINQSSVECTALAMGYTNVSNHEAIVAVSADAAAYICNGETGKSAHSIAEATASAFALAVAYASASCKVQGNTEVQVAASASAVAAANVWLSAYAEAFAGAGDCDKCNAYVQSYGYVEKEVFLKAVAKAEVKLSDYTSGGAKLAMAAHSFQAEIKKVAVSAFAEAIAFAADYKDTAGCIAWVNAGGCIYTPQYPNAVAPNCECEGNDCLAVFECSAVAVSISAIEEIDAIAEASASAAAWTCGNSVTIAELELTASALANATAVALSLAFAECETDGGWSCSSSYTDIEATARAVAEAYASAWAGEYACTDRCDLGVDLVGTAVGDILVTAATEAYAGVCVEGKEHFTDSDLEYEIEQASLCALAHATAFAVATPDFCLAGGVIYAGAVDECPEP